MAYNFQEALKISVRTALWTAWCQLNICRRNIARHIAAWYLIPFRTAWVGGFRKYSQAVAIAYCACFRIACACTAANVQNVCRTASHHICRWNRQTWSRHWRCNSKWQDIWNHLFYQLVHLRRYRQYRNKARLCISPYFYTHWFVHFSVSSTKLHPHYSTFLRALSTVFLIHKKFTFSKMQLSLKSYRFITAYLVALLLIGTYILWHKCSHYKYIQKNMLIFAILTIDVLLYIVI